MEVDLGNPLLAYFGMRRKDYKLQYEGLHDICFKCGKYGHREDYTLSPQGERSEQNKNNNIDFSDPVASKGKEKVRKTKSSFGPWMVAQRDLSDRLGAPRVISSMYISRMVTKILA